MLFKITIINTMIHLIFMLNEYIIYIYFVEFMSDTYNLYSLATNLKISVLFDLKVKNDLILFHICKSSS